MFFSLTNRMNLTCKTLYIYSTTLLQTKSNTIKVTDSYAAFFQLCCSWWGQHIDKYNGPQQTKDKNNRHQLQSETYFNLKGYIFKVERRFLSYMNIWRSLLFTSITHHKKKKNIQPFKILILVIFYSYGHALFQNSNPD